MVATIQISFAILLLFCSTYLSINTINEKQLLYDDSLKQFISIYSIIQKIEAQELSEDEDDSSLTSEVLDDTEIEEEFNDDLEAESLDQVDNNAIDLSKDIETPFDDLEAESLDRVDNNAIECLSNVTIAQSTNNNCSNDVSNPDVINDDSTIPPPPPIEEPTTTTDVDDDFIDPMDEQPIEPIPDPLVTEIPPSEPDVDTNSDPVTTTDSSGGNTETPVGPPLPPPPIVDNGPGGIPIEQPNTEGGVCAQTATLMDHKSSQNAIIQSKIKNNCPPIAISKIDIKCNNCEFYSFAKEAIVGSLGRLDGTRSYDLDPKDVIVDYLWSQTDNGPFRLNLPSPGSKIIPFNVPEKVPTRFVDENSVPEIIPLKFSLDVVDNHFAKSLKPWNTELRISCTNDEEKRADKVNQIVTNIIATENQLGYEEGPDRIQHWRAGSAAPLPLSENWLSQFSEIKQGVAKLHQLYEINPITSKSPSNSGNSLFKFAQSLKSGENGVFKDTWKYAIETPNPLSDFGVSIGRAQIVSDGVFDVTRTGPSGAGPLVSITGTVTYSLRDIFNFNPGDTFPIPVYPFLLPANDLNLLEKCRGAQPFIQEITWKQDVTYQGLISQMNNQFVWKWSPTKWNLPF
jgi:hypothetical protein